MRAAPAFWEKLHLFAILLWPLSWVFSMFAGLRRMAFRNGWFNSAKLPVPVIIVGNLRVGGTGKTPIVIALAKALAEAGYQPGIISRGYGKADGNESSEASQVLPESNPADYGDEPVLMARLLASLKIPVFIGTKRVAAGQALLKKYPKCDVIISDDGLQHYALQRHTARNGGRDIEIVVRDARAEGNGLLLPAGPLREPANRARDLTIQTGVDLPLSNINFLGGPLYIVNVKMGHVYKLSDPSQTTPLETFIGKPVLAAAGLGHPQKFFDIVDQTGVSAKHLPLPDHFSYATNPFVDPSYANIEVILITEKDAVKCQPLNEPRLWVVPLEASLPEELIRWIKNVIGQKNN